MVSVTAHAAKIEGGRHYEAHDCDFEGGFINAIFFNAFSHVTGIAYREFSLVFFAGFAGSVTFAALTVYTGRAWGFAEEAT